MIRRTLLTLALLAAPAIVVAQQPTPMQGAASADSSKVKPAARHYRRAAAKKHAAKPAAKPTAKPTAKPDTSHTSY